MTGGLTTWFGRRGFLKGFRISDFGLSLLRDEGHIKDRGVMERISDFGLTISDFIWEGTRDL